MRVKLIQRLSAEGLESLINQTVEVLEVSGYEIKNIKIQSSKTVWVALVMYGSPVVIEKKVVGPDNE